MIFELGGGKQVVVVNGRLTLWANRGCLGVELPLEQQEAIGLAMFRSARKAKRNQETDMNHVLTQAVGR